MLKRIIVFTSIIMSLILFTTDPLAATKKKRSYKQSSIPNAISPPGERVFIFSPTALQWGAYDANGNLVSKGAANGGSYYCPDIKRACHTPSGTYRVISKGTAACKSRLYPIKRIHGQIVRGGAHMPYCMYFSEVGYAIHGYSFIANRNNSHGCIRVTRQAAEWLSDSFIRVGTKVKVLSY